MKCSWFPEAWNPIFRYVATAGSSPADSHTTEPPLAKPAVTNLELTAAATPRRRKAGSVPTPTNSRLPVMSVPTPAQASPIRA